MIPGCPLKELIMRRIYLSFLCFTVTLAALGLLSRAQDKPADKPPVVVATFKSEALEESNYFELRFTRLAEAVPTEKYPWRPAEGVRSIGEVYAHIIMANYGLAKALGTPLPAGVDPKTFLAVANDKPKILQGLKDSFAHFRLAISALSDKDADKPQAMFGRQTTLRGAIMMIDRHSGEHLGQSIAYARMNGVVPPWTEDFQRLQKVPADKPKP
jgi:uncharacterized damage-inducible protein DinB